MWQYIIVRKRTRRSRESQWLCSAKNGKPKWIDWRSDKLANITYLSEDEMKAKLTTLRRYGKGYSYGYKRAHYLINGKNKD